MIIRRKINHNYTLMPNEFFNDESLTFEAIGVLAYLLSRPDDWKVHLTQLRKRGGFGRDKAQRIMRDLINAGYVVYQPIRLDDGTVKGSEYLVYDEPQKEGLEAVDREPENTVLGHRKPDHREPEKPAAGKQGPIYNTDLVTNTDKYIGHSQSDFPKNAFDQWYSNYPHKVAKGAGRKAFDKIQKNRQTTFSQLTSGLENYIRSKPKDIPWCNPATWLNAERWDDEPAGNDDTASPPPVRPETFTIQKWCNGILPTVQKYNNWQSSWGPAPGEPDCLAPKDIIPELTKALEAGKVAA